MFGLGLLAFIIIFSVVLIFLVRGDKYDRVVSQLSEIIILPQEEPLIAEITDAQLLRDSQPFYQDVENGQYLLIFPEQSRAIVYDYEDNMIINVGPLNVDQGETGEVIPEEEFEEGEAEDVESN